MKKIKCPEVEEGRGGRSAAGAVRGHALGLLGFIQAKKGGVDDFVFVNQGRASQRFAFVTVVSFGKRKAEQTMSAA